MTFLTGFSFLGQGANTAQAFITLKDWSERGRTTAPGRSLPTSTALRVVQGRQDHRAAAAADRQSRQFERLQLPPAGPRTARLRRTDEGEGPAARGGGQRARCFRTCMSKDCARAAGRADHRSREGRGAWRHVRGHQQHDLGQSRLGLHQRLPQPRPHAARRRAGRPRRAHAGRADPHLQCAQQPRPARADVVVRHSSTGRSVRRRSSASTIIRRSASAARQSPATPAATRSARWSGWRRSCRAASATNGPGSRCRKSCPVRRRRCCSRCRCCSCSCACGALRKLDHPARGAADDSARRARRGHRGDAARLAERRLFHRRPVTIIGLAAKDGILIIEFAKDAARTGHAAEATRPSKPAGCASGRS